MKNNFSTQIAAGNPALFASDHALLTPPEVQEFLKIKKSKFYELISSGDLPSARIGKSIRVKYSDLVTFIDLNLVGGAR